MRVSRKFIALAAIGILFAGAGILSLSFSSEPASAIAAEPYLGSIDAVGFNFAPRGWAHCNGQLLPISSNSALFSLLGTMYGGDGRTTFALPDLRGRVPVHMGTGPGLTNRRIGHRGGSESTTLMVQNLPSHNHLTAVVKGAPSAEAPGNAASGDKFNALLVDLTVGSGLSTTGLTGGGQAVNNMQPFLVVNYIICMQGLFPSRS